MFGYYDKGVFQMMVNKFKKLFEYQSEPKKPLQKKFKDASRFRYYTRERRV